ncbi:unnamed protein product [Plutella xylostella]|uniref:(diamondback moth) hypothetical protein n=1 Tax=Plutella xylostella TaxID=51655 RepID=A0A8S4F653_PLUXY|nr:unnamed protein product [Plutella xylostella]
MIIVNDNNSDVCATGVQTPICAVSGAQFLTRKGFVDLRSSLDADVPFSLFRDEGRTFLQWSGEDELRMRMSGRAVVVRAAVPRRGGGDARPARRVHAVRRLPPAGEPGRAAQPNQTTSVLVHPQSREVKLREENSCEAAHRDESSIERLPDEHVSIVETTEDRDIARPVGQTRRKLYFNPAYFEPHLMAEPPQAALEFLVKIREVIAIAKHKMEAKRFQPVLNEIPEEETYPSNGNSIDIYQGLDLNHRLRNYNLPLPDFESFECQHRNYYGQTISRVDDIRPIGLNNHRTRQRSKTINVQSKSPNDIFRQRRLPDMVNEAIALDQYERIQSSSSDEERFYKHIPSKPSDQEKFCQSPGDYETDSLERMSHKKGVSTPTDYTDIALLSSKS